MPGRKTADGAKLTLPRPRREALGLGLGQDLCPQQMPVADAIPALTANLRSKTPAIQGQRCQLICILTTSLAK